MTKTKTIDSIVLVGRRWNDGVNTYHTVSIYIDGEHKHRSDREYGYESAYIDSGWDWLEENGFFPGLPADWRSRNSYFLDE